MNSADNYKNYTACIFFQLCRRHHHFRCDIRALNLYLIFKKLQYELPVLCTKRKFKVCVQFTSFGDHLCICTRVDAFFLYISEIYALSSFLPCRKVIIVYSVLEKELIPRKRTSKGASNLHISLVRRVKLLPSSRATMYISGRMYWSSDSSYTLIILSNSLNLMFFPPSIFL